MFRWSYRWLASLALTGLAATAGAAERPGVDLADGWGPALGVEAPLLEATDQRGDARTFPDLKGANGLLLVFSRSVDW